MESLVIDTESAVAEDELFSLLPLLLQEVNIKNAHANERTIVLVIFII